MTEDNKAARLTPEREAEIRKQANDAIQEVIDLASGKRKWTMCVPPQPTDSDELLCGVADDALELLTEIAALRADVAAANERATQAERERDALRGVWYDEVAPVLKSIYRMALNEQVSNDQDGHIVDLARMILKDSGANFFDEKWYENHFDSAEQPADPAPAWTPKPGDRVRVKVDVDQTHLLDAMIEAQRERQPLIVELVDLPISQVIARYKDDVAGFDIDELEPADDAPRTP